jgi:hypothetical protein
MSNLTIVACTAAALIILAIIAALTKNLRLIGEMFYCAFLSIFWEIPKGGWKWFSSMLDRSDMWAERAMRESDIPGRNTEIGLGLCLGVWILLFILAMIMMFTSSIGDLARPIN